MKKLKQIFSLTNIIKAIGFLFGMLTNMLFVLFIYWLGTLIDANEHLGVILGSFFAYPLAELVRKYTIYGLRKLWIKEV